MSTLKGIKASIRDSVNRPQSALWCFELAQSALWCQKSENQIISENNCEIPASRRAIQFSRLNPEIKRHKALCGVLNKLLF